MLADLVTSLNITLPIFIMILLGWALKSAKLIDDHYLLRANDIIFRVALPVKLFYEVSACDLRANMDWRFVAVAIGVSILCMVIAWVVGSLFLKDPADQGAFIHTSFRGNFAYVGLALLQNVSGGSAMAAAAVVMATVIPLYNIAGVVVLSLKKPDSGKINVGRLLLDVVKTPMVLGILVAIPFSLMQIKFPTVVSKPLEYLSDMVTPMALLSVGASVSFASVLHGLREILPACGLKLIVQPLIMVPIGVALKLPVNEILVLLVLSGTPSAINSYIVTQRMGGNGELASSIVVMTTILSIFTLTLWLFALKSLGVW